MPKKITTKREPQVGTGKTLMKKCPKCGEYYLSLLYSHEKVKEKRKYIKKALFCSGCKYIEVLKENQ
jgi:hypothetical protein